MGKGKDLGPARGILVIDKESGPTSHDVVKVLRRVLGMRRVGHCGTLDPLATGVLVACFGRYTRLCDWIGTGEKEYEATLRLGAVSDTGDAEGKVTQVEGAPLELPVVAEALVPFRGWIDQVPPAHSAVKVRGVPSYRLARRQQAVTLEARRVEVKQLEVVDYEYPQLKLRLTCSRGTYVRSLAADLGESLGCGAHVTALRRLRVGQLSLHDAVTVASLEGSPDSEGTWRRHLAPEGRALAHMPPATLGAAASRSFVHGGSVTATGPADQACVVSNESGCLLGIGRWTEGGRALKPESVLCEPDELVAETGSPEVDSLAGVVVHGDGRGRTLGFATANLALDSCVSSRLRRGVYAGRTRWRGSEYGAVVNIGVRPTFDEGAATPEIHLLDFSGDLYGEELEVELVERLRDERRFASGEELAQQITRDIERAREILGPRISC
ncbi:tRNA pseudouridine(55) synthase TruB [Candidatus Latescibacterota bacterium]